jgi:hypothetical protein
MLVLILLIVIALVAWALHLMQEAITRQEFSLMLAGTLVASASAALVSVYFLVGNYMGYMNHLSPTPTEVEQVYEDIRHYIDQAQLPAGGTMYISDLSTTIADHK